MTLIIYMIDDIIALQYLYGTDTSLSVGDNIYDYSFFSMTNQGFTKLFEDAGGTDTFTLQSSVSNKRRIEYE